MFTHSTFPNYLFCFLVSFFFCHLIGSIVIITSTPYRNDLLNRIKYSLTRISIINLECTQHHQLKCKTLENGQFSLNGMKHREQQLTCDNVIDAIVYHSLFKDDTKIFTELHSISHILFNHFQCFLFILYSCGVFSFHLNFIVYYVEIENMRITHNNKQYLCFLLSLSLCFSWLLFPSFLLFLLLFIIYA